MERGSMAVEGRPFGGGEDGDLAPLPSLVEGVRTGCGGSFLPFVWALPECNTLVSMNATTRSKTSSHNIRTCS